MYTRVFASGAGSFDLMYSKWGAAVDSAIAADAMQLGFSPAGFVLAGLGAAALLVAAAALLIARHARRDTAALLSDLHKIDKALLQALLFFVVAATLTMAYGVSSAADEAVAEVRRGIGGSVLATRAGALPDPLDKGSGYPYSVAKGLGASKYVKGSSFYVCVNGAETGSIKGIPVVSSSMFALFPDWEGLGRP